MVDAVEASGVLVHLHRAAGSARQHVERAVLRRERLTWTGFAVLHTVWRATRIETRHAAARAGIAKGTLTGVVKTLTARDLMRRVSHPEDRRLVLLELTSAGQHMMRRVLPALHAEEAFALACLTVEERAQVAAVLARVLGHLESPAARRRRSRPVAG